MIKKFNEFINEDIEGDEETVWDRSDDSEFPSRERHTNTTKGKNNNARCKKCDGWINPSWTRGDGSYRHCDCPKITNELFGGFKRALSLDTVYQSNEDAFDKMYYYVKKKYQLHLNKKVIRITDANHIKKTISFNGKVIPMDKLKREIDNFVNHNSIMLDKEK